MEEVKDRISVEHSYCAPLTPIEPQDGNTEIGSVYSIVITSEVPSSEFGRNKGKMQENYGKAFG